MVIFCWFFTAILCNIFHLNTLSIPYCVVSKHISCFALFVTLFEFSYNVIESIGCLVALLLTNILFCTKICSYAFLQCIRKIGYFNISFLYVISISNIILSNTLFKLSFVVHHISRKTVCFPLNAIVFFVGIICTAAGSGPSYGTCLNCCARFYLSCNFFYSIILQILKILLTKSVQIFCDT